MSTEISHAAPERERQPGWTALALFGVILGATSWGLLAMASSALAVVAPVETVAAVTSIVGLQMALGSYVALFRPVARGIAIVGIAVTATALGMCAWLGPGQLSTARTAVRAGGDVALAGTIFKPRGAPIAGAVWIHGSGCETRKELAFYARELARRGIASIAYDKRGCGDSTGELYDGTYDDYAADAVQAAEHLRSALGLEHVGFIGFSEGEWVGMLAARKYQATDFLVVISPSGMPPADQTVEEVDIRLERAGFSDEDRAAARALMERLNDYYRSGNGKEDLAAALDEAKAESWFEKAEDFPTEPPEDLTWWRSVMDFDDTESWTHIHVPTLIIKGGYDDRSRPERVREGIAAGVPPATLCDWLEIDGADHAILFWPKGEGNPPPVFADGYPAVIGEWIRRLKDQEHEPMPSMEPCIPPPEIEKPTDSDSDSDSDSESESDSNPLPDSPPQGGTPVPDTEVPDTTETLR